MLQLASIDAYSDYRDALPPAVEGAQQWLPERGQRERGQQGRRPGDPCIGVPVPLQDEEAWSIVSTYAAWSIYADFFGETNEDPLASMNDSALSITAELTDDEAKKLAERLADVTPILPLAELHSLRHRRSLRQRLGKALRRP